MAFTISKTFVLALAFGMVYTTAKPITRNEGPTDNTELIAKLKTDGTRFDQFHDILTTDGQDLLAGEELTDATVFDFNRAYPVPGGEGGSVATAYVDNFPMLIESGITFSVASLGPCGIFFPHIHPRATELFTVIEGELSFGYQLEGAVLPTDPSAKPAIPLVEGKLTKFTGTVFPQGSVHYQINHSCEPATIVATLSSEDAGTTGILQQPASDGNGTMMVKGKRQADIGNLEMYYPLLPPMLVDAAKQCIARCK